MTTPKNSPNKRELFHLTPAKFTSLHCRAMGAVGYFPTYTLGAAFAVQLFNQIEKEMPSMHDNIASGNFSPIREWLREKVRRFE